MAQLVHVARREVGQRVAAQRPQRAPGRQARVHVGGQTLGDQHLASVPGGVEAGALVDDRAGQLPAVEHDWLPEVQSHAHA